MPVKFRSEGGAEARERPLGRKWLVQMLSELTHPASSKACSEQTRPGLNVKNKLFYFCTCSLWLKSTSTACLEPKSIYKTIEKSSNMYTE